MIPTMKLRYAGVITVVQAIGILELAKLEVKEQNE